MLHCELVHQMAHGNLPVLLQKWKLVFMKTDGKNHKLDNGYVRHADGSMTLVQEYFGCVVYGIIKASVQQIFLN
jgi:hypothetical protein